jgi:O-antigen ligase
MHVFGLILMATLAFGVLAFGGVYPWAYWLLAFASAGLGLWAIVVCRAWRDWRVWRLAKVMAVVAAAIALQMVPLPRAAVETISPNAAAVLSQYELAYAARQGGWTPISLAPWDTLVALALFTAFALLLVGATRALRHMDPQALAARLTILALLVGLIGIVQRALTPAGSDLVYGFWQPQFDGDGFGPFVNRNHYAGWVVMLLPLVAARIVAATEAFGGLTTGAGAATRRLVASQEAGLAAFSAGVVVVLGIAVMLSGSRSGLASLAVALATLAIFVVSRAGWSRRRMVVVLSVPLLLAAAMAWAGRDIAIRRFGQVPVEIADRIAAWTDTLHIIGDFPVAGVGLGAYATAMAVYQTAPTHTLFVQAHNDYLQVAAEGGLLVGLPALAALLLIGQGIRRRFVVGDHEPARYWLRAGAVAGLAGIAAQSLVEFSLQKPGNTVLFVVLVALALHRPDQDTSADAHRV